MYKDSLSTPYTDFMKSFKKQEKFFKVLMKGNKKQFMSVGMTKPVYVCGLKSEILTESDSKNKK